MRLLRNLVALPPSLLDTLRSVVVNGVVSADPLLLHLVAAGSTQLDQQV